MIDKSRWETPRKDPSRGISKKRSTGTILKKQLELYRQPLFSWSFRRIRTVRQLCLKTKRGIQTRDADGNLDKVSGAEKIYKVHGGSGIVAATAENSGTADTTDEEAARAGP